MTGAGQSRHRFLAHLAGTALLLLAASAGVARAEPLPGLLDPREVARARAEAAEQKRDAQRAVRASARPLGYSDREIERVLEPAMVRSGTFRTRLDDGTVIEFPWYRIGFAENRLANTGKPIGRDASGAPLRMETNKGGVRLHHGVFADEVYALALKMDVKLAITGDAIEGHSVRGAKGGIGAGRVVKVGSRYQARVGDLVDPASPALDRQELMRSFARSYRASGGEVGPGLDIQAGDVNTKAREMKTLAESYGSRRAPSDGVSGKAVITRPSGEADPRGGIAYRSVSTGEGVWMSARLAARRAGLKLRGATVVAQGWGEVGRAFGMAAVKDGARVIAVQNLWMVDGKKVAGTLLHPRGAKATLREVRAWLADIDAAVSSGEDLATFKGGELKEMLHPELDASQVRADIVGLNALASVLTEETVPQYVRSGTHSGARKVIVEGANLAQTAGGAELIDRNARSLLVVSGELANIGGVHVSNLEAVQNLYGEEVTSKTARRSLASTMRSGFRRAMKIADQRGISERAAIELAAVDALMKRSLERPDAPRRSLERGVISAARRAKGRLAQAVHAKMTRAARAARAAKATRARAARDAKVSRAAKAARAKGGRSAKTTRAAKAARAAKIARAAKAAARAKATRPKAAPTAKAGAALPTTSAHAAKRVPGPSASRAQLIRQLRTRAPQRGASKARALRPARAAARARSASRDRSGARRRLGPRARARAR